MTTTTPLRRLAHARAGDKGNISNVSVWAYRPEDYPAIARALTPQRIRAAFPQLALGKVEVYALPQLHGLNIVMHEALEGGVNTSLNLDGHGKSWSYLILGLEIESMGGEPERL